MSEPTPLVTIEATEARTCLLCGSEGGAVYEGLRDPWMGVPGTWAFRRCARCDLAWLDPQPLREDVGKLYGEGYYTHGPVEAGAGPPAGPLRRIVKRAVRPRDPAGDGADAGGSRVEGVLARAVGRVAPFREVAAGLLMWLGATPPGRLLDVGCGDGSFLARMRDRGWEVTGVEPNHTAIETARTHHGLNVIESPLEYAELPAAAFDVVTMSHVIEHVVDPLEVLRKCWRVLRPGGRLVVVTPNLRSLGRAWFGRRWMGWEVPRHLFVFSPRSLDQSVARTGLERTELRTTARSLFSSVPSIRVLSDGSSSRGPTRAAAVAFWLVEHLWQRVRACGEEILLIAERPR